MFCMYCGKELPKDALFCAFCGNKTFSETDRQPISVPAPVAQPVPQPAPTTHPQIQNFDEDAFVKLSSKLIGKKVRRCVPVYPTRPLVPEYAFYAFARIFSSYKFGATYFFEDNSIKSDYIEGYKSDPMFSLTRISGTCYLVEMEFADFLKMFKELSEIPPVNAIDEYGVKATSRELSNIVKYIIKTKVESIYLSIYSLKAETIVKHEGISYLSVKTTIREVAPVLDYFGYKIKIGGGLIEPMRALELFENNDSSFTDNLKVHYLKGILIEAKKG